jgi:hypothetical protein
MATQSYEDWYDNGPGSEAFKRSCMAAPKAEKPRPVDHTKELAYLRWFKQNADFGPADGDVHRNMDDAYESRTGNKVPDNWRTE